VRWRRSVCSIALFFDVFAATSCNSDHLPDLRFDYKVVTHPQIEAAYRRFIQRNGYNAMFAILRILCSVTAVSRSGPDGTDASARRDVFWCFRSRREA
jgi:uncharacterized membrane-anchored protein